LLSNFLLEKKTFNDFKVTKIKESKHEREKEKQQIEYFKILDPTAERKLMQHFNFASSFDHARKESKRTKSVTSEQRKTTSKSASHKHSVATFDDVAALKKEESWKYRVSIQSEKPIFYYPRSISKHNSLMSEIASRRRRKILSNLQYLDLHERPRCASDSFGTKSHVLTNCNPATTSKLNRPVSVTHVTSSGDAIKETYVFQSYKTKTCQNDGASTEGDKFSERCNEDEKKVLENMNNKG